ncbi:MAG: MopE-related protein [Myxococcota bacterium]
MDVRIGSVLMSVACIHGPLAPTETSPTPPIPTESSKPTEPKPADRDGDGFTADIDCDDANSTIYPGAPEFCDAIDQDCDDEVETTDLLTYFPTGERPRDLLAELESRGRVRLEGGRVVACPGTYSVSQTTEIAGVVEIVSSEKARDGVVWGAVDVSTLQLLPGSQLTVEGITLTGEGPAVIAADGARLRLTDVAVSEAEVDEVIAMFGSQELTVQDSVFEGSTTTGDLFRLDAAAVSFIDVHIQGNDTSGALLFSESSQHTLNNVVLTDNLGGVELLDGAVELSSVTVSLGRGAAPAIHLREIESGFANGVVVSDNPGDGIRFDRTVPTTLPFAFMSFDNIVGERNAGSGFILSASADQIIGMDESRFEGNGGPLVDGGGVRVLGAGAILETGGVDLIGNTANRGGAVYLGGGFAYFEDSMIWSNTASDGALFVEDLVGYALLETVCVNFGEDVTANAPADAVSAADSLDLVGKASVTCTGGGCTLF